MLKVWEFFEHLQEIMYAADADTYEIIYMNRRTLELCGYSSLDEVVGKNCYEVIQKAGKPCAMCNNHQLQEGRFLEWCYYNPLYKRTYSIKDTLLMDGNRRCRIELAMDITEQKQQVSMAEGYHNLETIANEGFRLALQTATPEVAIHVILEYLGKALQAERAYIFECNHKGNDDNTYEWVKEGVDPVIHLLQDLPAEVCAQWYDTFRENENILIGDLEDIRITDPLQYENLKRQDIHSLVVVPLYDGKKIIGFYGVDNPDADSLAYVSNMLQIVAHFIIYTLRQREYVQKLTHMSHYDRLTGLGNRYLMDEYVASRRSGESLGVVYCDITGLKRVNDTLGHAAGDRLIIRAAECLKKVLKGHGLFRIGGDEMLAWVLGLTEEEFYEKINELKDELPIWDVVMAIGAIWQEDGMAHLDYLLTESERLMYEDKSEYYKQTGIDRRR